jgi:hypothetical protein
LIAALHVRISPNFLCFPLARILHEAFYCERREHGIFGSIPEVRTRMYFSTIRPQTAGINFAPKGPNLPHFHRSRYEVSCNMRASLTPQPPMNPSFSDPGSFDRPRSFR